MYRFAMNLNINLLFQSFFEEKYHNCQLSTVNCQFLLQSDKLEFYDTIACKKAPLFKPAVLFQSIF